MSSGGNLETYPEVSGPGSSIINWSTSLKRRPEWKQDGKEKPSVTDSFSLLLVAKLTPQFPSQTSMRKIPSLCLYILSAYTPLNSREHDASELHSWFSQYLHFSTSEQPPQNSHLRQRMKKHTQEQPYHLTRGYVSTFNFKTPQFSKYM